MSWDWDKLQEKRRNQDKPPRKNIDPRNFFRPPNKDGFGGSGISKVPSVWFVLVLFFLIFLGFGLFFVQPEEVAVVTRLGTFNRLATKGPHFKLPYPLESATVVSLKEVSIDLGRTAEASKRSGSLEAAMITKDWGLAFLRYRIRYKVDDARAYLGGTRNPESLLEYHTEAAMRAAVMERSLNDLLERDYTKIQKEVLAAVKSALEAYPLGLMVTSIQLISVEPPAETAGDLKNLTNAQAEKSRLLEEANALRETILPAARKEAEKALLKAELESTHLVQEAEGQALRIGLLAEEYRRNPVGAKYSLCLILAGEAFSGTGRTWTLEPPDTPVPLCSDSEDRKTEPKTPSSPSGEAVIGKTQTSSEAKTGKPAPEGSEIKDPEGRQ